MKSNFKIIITAIIAVAIGLGAGYLIFGNNTDSASLSMESHQHAEETTSSDGEGMRLPSLWYGFNPVGRKHF